MSPSTIIALASLLVAVVAVVGGMWERRRSSQTANEQRRSLLVAQVIERLERVVRVQSRPVWFRLWANPELEFSLALPRLTLLVSDREKPLLEWFALQTKRMQRASTDRKATAIGIETVSTLAAWFRNDRTMQWFDDQLVTSAAMRPEPARRKFRRQISAPIESTLLVALTLFFAGLPALMFAVGSRVWPRVAALRRRSAFRLRS